MFSAEQTHNAGDHQGMLDHNAYNEFGGTVLGNPKHVLIVDDDNGLREFLELILTDSNFKVTSVDNAQDALDIFNNQKFEIVLTDIQMPGMDGWELASKIKMTSPETPVILMTGMQKDQVEKKMKNGLADSILYKPFNLNQIETILNGFLVNQE